MGPTVTRLVLDPLAVLLLDNRLYICACNPFINLMLHLLLLWTEYKVDSCLVIWIFGLFGLMVKYFWLFRFYLFGPLYGPCLILSSDVINERKSLLRGSNYLTSLVFKLTSPKKAFSGQAFFLGAPLCTGISAVSNDLYIHLVVSNKHWKNELGTFALV